MSQKSNTSLFGKITDDENMHKAYKQTRRGKGKYKEGALKFYQDEVYNLIKLKQSLIDETYKMGEYITFPVYEPKPRRIDAPDYESKIVQLCINNVLKEVYYDCFIYDNYACIDNKGTHKCVDRIQHFLRKAKWEYGEDACIIKIDIAKFFYTIDRKTIKKILPKRIKCKKTLRLLFKIIDSADILSPLGLPLGNTISQICASVYMNEVDQFAKRKLSLKYYVRYADDVIIIMKNKAEAQDILSKIEDFINSNLQLSLNEKKTKLFPLEQGVNTVGYKIYTTHRLLRNDSKKKIKRKAKKMKQLIRNKKMTIEKAEQILNSWKGHADHGCSYNFIQKLINKNDYIYINAKKVLKIDITKI